MMILRCSRLSRSVQYESVSLTNPLKHLLTRQALLLSFAAWQAGELANYSLADLGQHSSRKCSD